MGSFHNGSVRRGAGPRAPAKTLRRYPLRRGSAGCGGTGAGRPEAPAAREAVPRTQMLPARQVQRSGTASDTTPMSAFGIIERHVCYL